MKPLLMIFAMSLWASAAVAQTQGIDCSHVATTTQHDEHCDHQHHLADQRHQTNPDAGTSAGLSEAQRAQYLNGEGMGLAKPAEMNHYPGPRHVLQNADRMKLSPEQLAATQKLFDAVQEKAKKLGGEIVDREDELVRIFSSHTADEARVKQLAEEIGSLQGELRAAHLTAHLQERSLLSPEQIRVYDEARDYVPGQEPAPLIHQH